MNPSILRQLLLSVLVINTLYLEEIKCQEIMFQVQNIPPEIIPGLYPGDLFNNLTPAFSELQPVFLYAPSPVPQNPGPSYPRSPVLDSSRPSLTYGFVPRSRPTSTQTEEDSNRYRSAVPSHQRHQPPRQTRYKSAETDTIVPAHSLQSTSKVRALSSLGPLRPRGNVPQHNSRPVSYGQDARGNYVPVYYDDGQMASTNSENVRLGSRDTNSERNPRKTSDNLKNGQLESSIPTTNWEQNSDNQNRAKASTNLKNGLLPTDWQQNLHYHTEHLKNGQLESAIPLKQNSNHRQLEKDVVKNIAASDRNTGEEPKYKATFVNSPVVDPSTKRYLVIKAPTLVTTKRPASAPFVASSFRNIPQSAPRPDIGRQSTKPAPTSTANRNITKEESPYILDIPDSDLYYQVEDDPLLTEGRFDAEAAFRNASGAYLPAQSISSSVSVNLNGDAENIEKSHLKKSAALKKVPTSDESDDVPGVPGSDYPTYYEIPPTQFECKDSTTPGFYADLETGCQVFHNCDTRRQKYSFLCPNGTVFRQELFICDWWYNVRCETSPEHFPLNDGIFPRL